MASFLKPKTYLVGATHLEHDGLEAYLKDTKQLDFLTSIAAAKEDKLHDGECLVSFSAKLCYKSVVLGRNANVTRVRDIPANIRGCIEAGHSSVFGHLCLNFVTTNCSRIFTHELIRHEVGTDISVPPLDGLHEWSQTSGRYVRLDAVDIVMDPILSGCEDLGMQLLTNIEDTVYLMECKTGLRVAPAGHAGAAPEASLAANCKRYGISPENVHEYRWLPNDKLNFDYKKKVTSAIRRFAVNGQVNEIFWTVNVRALRHMLQMRTNRHAEYEIRLVFGQVFELVKEKFPACFADATSEIVNGMPEVTGMRTQPYAPKAVADLADHDLLEDLRRRGYRGTLTSPTDKTAQFVV